MYMNSRVCCDCGEIGLPGFKSSPIHNCLQRGYRINEAVAFLNKCEICKELFCLVFCLLYHSATIHLRIPAVYCPLFSCGHSFYNKGYMTSIAPDFTTVLVLCCKKFSVSTVQTRLLKRNLLQSFLSSSLIYLYQSVLFFV